MITQARERSKHQKQTMPLQVKNILQSFRLFIFDPADSRADQDPLDGTERQDLPIGCSFTQMDVFYTFCKKLPEFKKHRNETWSIILTC